MQLLCANETHYTCQSNHLTSFAVLVKSTPVQQVGVDQSSIYHYRHSACICVDTDHSSQRSQSSRRSNLHWLLHVNSLSGCNTILVGDTQVSHFLCSIFCIICCPAHETGPRCLVFQVLLFSQESSSKRCFALHSLQPVPGSATCSHCVCLWHGNSHTHSGIAIPSPSCD